MTNTEDITYTRQALDLIDRARDLLRVVANNDNIPQALDHYHKLTAIADKVYKIAYEE